MATSTFISSSLVSSNVYLWDKYGSNAYLNGGIALTRKAAADANGRFCWSSGTLSRFTNTATPKLYDPIYATAAATDQTVVTSVTSVGATGIYAGGSGLLLAPTTRLGCVEMNTAGGISRDGDTLSWGPDTNLSGWLDSRYVPLSKTSTGTPTPMTYELTSTMYGNMFSPNASAVVGSVGISTGYGTLLLNSYTVVNTIRAEVPPGALTIPSESAAAIALAYKQDKITVVGGGEMLHIDSNSYLHISSTGAIALTSSAGWDHKIPSEMAVRGAINIASADCINHADDLYDIINNSHYATEVWVTENFALKGEGGGGQIEGSYGPATYNSEGMIRPVLGGGLVITDAAHADLSVASATSAVFGGIRLGSNFYTTSRTVEVDHVNTLVSHCLTLSAATTDVLGGITVPTGNGGLILSSGALSLNVASSYADYTVAAAGTYGGVKVVRTIEGTTVNNYLYSGYVPSVQAVYDHVSGLLTYYTDTVTLNANFATKAPPSDQNAGIIIPGSGLDQDGYVVNLAKATPTSIGGIIVGSGLSADGTGKLDVTPATTTSLGGVTVPASGGIDIDASGNITMSSASYVTTSDGASSGTTYKPLGGVRVWDSGGLLVSNGVLSLREANISSGYGYYNTRRIGGVLLGSALTSGYPGQPASVARIAPTLDLLTVAVKEREPIFFVSDCKLNSTTNVGTAYIASGLLLDSDGTILASKSKTSVTFDQGTANTIYAKFSSNTTTNQWDINYQLTSATDAANVFYRPIAYISAGAGVGSDANSVKFNGKIHQYQWGAVRLGESGGGGGEAVPYASYTIAGKVQPIENQGLEVGAGGALTLAKATTNTIGGVVVGDGINVTNGTISLAAQPATAAYTGPFAVTYSGTATNKVNVAKGYVKWLDGYTLIAASNGIALAANEFIYLVGSSGRAAGEVITGSAYSATVLPTGNNTTPVIYSRTTTSYTATGTSRFKWTTAGGSMWAPSDLGVGTQVYATSNGTTAIGEVTYFSGTITVGGNVYSRTSDDAFDTITWVNNGAVKYTTSAWPKVNDHTLFTVSSRFGYATTEPSLPPAGVFYTMLAQNSGGNMHQQQFGTVWHEHWGDDYRGQFSIVRIERTAMSATTVPTIGTYPYRYIIANGGRIYGGLDFKNGRFWAGTPVSGGIITAPGDMEYPTITVAAPGTATARTYTDGATTVTKNDGLYFPYGAGGEVWLNVWSGTWPAAWGGNDSLPVMWHTVVHSVCLEGYIPNCYSVQLGWVTGNGAPQQDHKGPVAIRGRWT